jgi:hypothetical protein
VRVTAGEAPNLLSTRPRQLWTKTVPGDDTTAPRVAAQPDSRLTRPTSSRCILAWPNLSPTRATASNAMRLVPDIGGAALRLPPSHARRTTLPAATAPVPVQQAR